MTGILEGLQYLPPVVVLAIAVILVAGETGVVVGLLFPVEIPLMTVGFLAYQGEVPFWPAMALMLVAAAAGDALALRSGHKYGPRMRASRLGGWVGEPRWSRADRVLRRLGGRSAFVARWVPFVRTLLPRLAGSVGMPYRTYAPWNYAGVVTAVGSSVVLGYLAGASYARVAESFGRATTAVLLLMLTAGGVVVVGRWLGRNRYPVRALRSRLGAVPGPRRERPPAESGWWTVADLTAGLVLWSGAGLALSWAVQFAVGHSGMSGVDGTVTGWLADAGSGPLVDIARITAPVFAVAVLVSLAAALLLELTRGGASHWGVVCGLAVLAVLVVTANLSGGDSSYTAPLPSGGFSTSAAVVIAGLGMLVWLTTRRAGWLLGAMLWGLALASVAMLVAARLYLGWDTMSGAVAAALLATAWLALLSVAARGWQAEVTRSVTIP